MQLTAPAAGKSKAVLRRVVMLSVVVFVVALTLLAVEFALRWFVPIYVSGIPEIYLYDPELGLGYEPDIHRFKLTDHQEEVRVNKLGTNNFQEHFAAYHKLVFALGDSFTQGTGTPSDASYPFQLDLMLNMDTTGAYVPQIGVVNLGRNGYGPLQGLVMLRRYAALLGPPKACLVLGSDNDADDDAKFRSGFRHRSLMRGTPRYGRFGAILQRLSNNSQLLLRTKIVWWRFKARNEIPTTVSSAEAVWPAVAAIRAQCAEFGAPTIVSWADSYDHAYVYVKEHAAGAGLVFADWLPRVASVKKTIPDLPLDNNHSGGHHRVWVNRLIAETFRDALLQASHDSVATP